MNAGELREAMPSTAVAFQGYDRDALGRSRELLEHTFYGPILEEYLSRAGAVCNDFASEKTGLRDRLFRRSPARSIDLVQRVRDLRETRLEDFPEAVGLIVGTELAHLKMLETYFQVPYTSAQLAFGHSLGEIGALIAGGVLTLEEALKVPLNLARECVELADGVTLGILFSRGRQLSMEEVLEQCTHINCEGDGVIGISAQLSPNTLLVMGQGTTLDRLKQRMQEQREDKILLRKTSGQWPPLHTLLVCDRYIPNRSAVMLRGLKGGFSSPTVPILSLVTGKISYNEFNAREILCQWCDHPQRAWDAVYGALSMGVTTIVHVGPAPNIFPSTFKRLSDNVEAQIKAHRRTQAISGMIRRPWLKALLPARASLLRAPRVRHIVLEDWLLAQRL